MGYMFEFELTVQVNHGPPEDLDSFSDMLDQITETLGELDGVVDPFLGANLREGKVTVHFGSTDQDHEDDIQALEKAAGALRTALHAVGMATPGWERLTWKLDSASPSSGDRVEA